MLLALLLSTEIGRQDQVPATPVTELPRPYVMPLGDNAFADVKFEIKRGVQFASFECRSTCLGQKHLTHSQCDGSCDAPCEYRHQKEVRSFLSPNTWRTPELDGALGTFGLNRQAGAGLMANLRSKMERAVGNPRQYVVPILDRHWSQPCSAVSKVVREARVTYMANITLLRNTVRPDGTTAVVTGPKCSVEVGTLIAPVDFLPSTVQVACECEIVSESYLDEDCEEFGGVFIDPDMGDGKEEQQYCNSALQQQFGLTCTVESMTECTFTATNPTTKPVEICVYAGTRLESGDDAYQDMGTCAVARLTLEAALAGPALPSTKSVKVRVACLEMGKREPSATVKFKIGRALPDGLRRLARFGEKERFKTVLDQMRTWIVTDQAALAEMQKYLIFPKPSAGQYLRAIETVSSVGGYDLAEPAFRKCLDAKLIGGAPSSAEAVQKFVELLETVDSAGLARAAGQSANFAELWSDGAKSYGPQHAAHVARALADSESNTVRQAAVQFLMQTVPTEGRAAVATENALAGVGSWLFTPDEIWARKSLEALREYRSPASVVFLLNADESLPADLRAECLALAKELAGAPPPFLESVFASIR